MKRELPHPAILLSLAIGAAAMLTWVLPAGEYDRMDDPVTGRRIVVAGTYHAVDRAPVGPFAAVMAAPRGFAEAVDVIAATDGDVFIVSHRKDNGFYGFPNGIVEKEFGVPATSRNWSTITKIVRLLGLQTPR